MEVAKGVSGFDVPKMCEEDDVQDVPLHDGPHAASPESCCL